MRWPTGCGEAAASDPDRTTVTDRASGADAIVSEKEGLDVNDMLNPNMMLEATSLTRAGRLAEATTLLQRMLRGETAPDMSFSTFGEITPAGRPPPIIDAKTETIGETDRPLFRAATTAKSSRLRCPARFVGPRQSSLRARIPGSEAASHLDAGHCAGRRKVHRSDFQQLRRDPRLQALHPQSL